MKKPVKVQQTIPLIPLLFLIIIAVFAGFNGYLYTDLKSYKEQNKVQVQHIVDLTAKMSDSNKMAPSVVVPSENFVYLPDIRLKLPISNLAAQLVYGSRNLGTKADEQVVDISTASYESFVPIQSHRLACMPVRIAFEAQPNPYNPSEKPQKPVKLAGGRTLQIYATSEPSCDERWKLTGVRSFDIASLFQQARSY